MNNQHNFQQTHLLLSSDNELSNYCQDRELNARQVSELRKQCRHWFNTHVQPVRIGNREERFVTICVLESGAKLTVRKGFLGETIDKNKCNSRLVETMETATHFEEWIPNAQFIRTETGVHHPFPFSVYHTSYNGVDVEFKTKDNGQVYTMRLI